MNDKFLVTCYTEPDLDGFACAIAYAEFLNKTGRPAGVKFFGTPNIEARYLMEKFNFKYPPEVKTGDFEKFILVDSSELRDLDEIIKPEKVVEIIDHRQVNDAASFKNAKIQIELVGSAATLIAEKFHDSMIEISVPAATLLYGAIISNTLNFRAKVTTDRDRLMADWLNTKLGFGNDFTDGMFRAKSDLLGEKLAERIRGDFAWFDIRGKKIGIAQLEIMDAKELVKSRKDETIGILANLKSELSLDQIFISLIDLGEGFNIFITTESETQELLAKILGIEFRENAAIRDGFIMRKEIVPLIKETIK